MLERTGHPFRGIGWLPVHKQESIASLSEPEAELKKKDQSAGQTAFKQGWLAMEFPGLVRFSRQAFQGVENSKN